MNLWHSWKFAKRSKDVFNVEKEYVETKYQIVLGNKCEKKNTKKSQSKEDST